jgi:ABC-type phosphate transport system substrate-binding protein
VDRDLTGQRHRLISGIRRVDWPSGTGAKGSSGLAAALSRTKGPIGYVDVVYSLENNFDYAAIQNRAGSEARVLEAPGDRAAGRPQGDQQHLLSP